MVTAASHDVVEWDWAVRDSAIVWFHRSSLHSLRCST